MTPKTFLRKLTETEWRIRRLLLSDIPQDKKANEVLRVYREVYKLSPEKWYEEARRAVQELRETHRKYMPLLLSKFMLADNKIDKEDSRYTKAEKVLNISSMLYNAMNEVKR
jgi:DNA polymerase III delta prime subunit